MRKIRFVILAALGIIGIALPLVAEQVTYFTDVLYLDENNDIVGEWSQNCYGGIYHWGVQTETRSVMNGQCYPDAPCDAPEFVWVSIDGGGLYCVTEEFLKACCYD